MHHVVKSGDSFFHPAGETQPDVRVLRPITYYGNFGEDGRLKWGVGDEVMVGEAFTVAEKDPWGDEKKKELAKDTKGTVLEFNAEGAAKIAFREPVSAESWVPKDQFYRLFPLPNARDTPIQRRVKLARLRRCDVLALVLYTGVCVYLCGCEPRELMPSLSLLTAPCPFPSGLSNDACSGESRSCSRTNHAHQSSGPMFVLYNALMSFGF